MKPLSAVLMLLLTAAVAAAQSGPSVSRLTYIKEFPGSQPDYLAIAVSPSGEAAFRTAPEEKPLEFQLSPEVTGQIFSLVQRLNFLENADFESKRRVAQMGKKTFQYESGTQNNSVSFNHTEQAEALSLTSLFEGLSRTLWHADRLEYLLRFDRLGVVRELLQVEIQLDQGVLVEPDLLLPVLRKIQANNSLVNVAHQRVAQILAKLNQQEVSR